MSRPCKLHGERESKSMGRHRNGRSAAYTKFVVATWKDTQLWYAYRPRRADEKPETVTLQEQSSFGLVEGRVIFTER